MRRASDSVELSWSLLGSGLGVMAAVWALLDLLRHVVGHRVDRSVTDVWVTARQLAQNTQTLHILNATQKRAVALVEELEHHREQAGGRKG